MRLSEERIEILAGRIADRLLDDELVAECLENYTIFVLDEE